MPFHPAANRAQHLPSARLASFAQSPWLRSNVLSRSFPARRSRHNPREATHLQVPTRARFFPPETCHLFLSVSRPTRVYRTRAHAWRVPFRSTRIPQSEESFRSTRSTVAACPIALVVPMSLCPGIGQSPENFAPGKSASPSRVPPSERKTRLADLSPEFPNRATRDTSVAPLPPPSNAATSTSSHAAADPRAKNSPQKYPYRAIQGARRRSSAGALRSLPASAF